jgi:hypothetical protein
MLIIPDEQINFGGGSAGQLNGVRRAGRSVASEARVSSGRFRLKRNQQR